MKETKHSIQKRELLKKSGVLNPCPEAVKDSLFTEREFFDPRDLIQVKYEMIRRVERDGESIKGVVAEYGFSRPLFYKARQDFENGGLAGLIPEKRGPRRPHKLTAEVMDFLKRKRLETPSISYLDLSDKVREEFQKNIHPRTIERVLGSAKKKQN